MFQARTRIGRIRRRVAGRAFLCGALWGVAVAQVAILGGGSAVAAALMALSVGGLVVMVLGVRIGDLRRRKEELDDMLGSVHAGVIVLDAAEVCVAFGGRLHELLEMRADWDPTGLGMVEILTELADRGDFGPRVPPCLPVDPGLFRSPAFREVYLETPRGRIVSVSVCDLPRGGWVLTYTDITEHKGQTRMVLRAQRELELSEARARQLAREAEGANAAKSAFLTAISHEIRTPMNGIIGMSELLAESGLTEEQHAQVATIRQSCESLLVLVSDILDLSKIEAGRMTLDNAPFDLRCAIEDVLRLVCPKARPCGLAVRLDYGAGVPELFVGDRQRFRQVLINLVGNAVKFTPRGSVVVRVRGKARGQSRRRSCGEARCQSGGAMALEIAVEDTGIGIAEEHLSRIFDEFARVEGAGARHFEGTGLGLAISKRLVEMMAGEITVRSELGVGTTFMLRLELPVVPADMPVERSQPAPHSPPQPQSALQPARRAEPGTAAPLLVLLVEDNRTNQTVVSMMLENEPIDLRIARDGREATVLFRDLAPDLVLMDVCMPEMDGFAATTAIRRIEAERGLPRTPVVALTAYAGQEHRARCVEHDMDDYLTKPLNKSELVATIFARGGVGSATRRAPALDRTGGVPCG